MSDASQRVRVLERAPEFGVDDRVGVGGLVTARVADRALSLAGSVRPAPQAGPGRAQRPPRTTRQLA
jgi:hypothetical protein